MSDARITRDNAVVVLDAVKDGLVTLTPKGMYYLLTLLPEPERVTFSVAFATVCKEIDQENAARAAASARCTCGRDLVNGICPWLRNRGLTKHTGNVFRDVDGGIFTKTDTSEVETTPVVGSKAAEVK